MKAFHLQTRGGPEALVYEGPPRARPKAEEVLVRAHAAAVNPTELMCVHT